MNDAVTTGLLVLLGVFVTQLFELLKRYSGERRWYADYFLPKKFDAIANLYALAQQSHAVVSVYRYRKLNSPQECQKIVISEISAFNRAGHVARLYLPENVHKLLSDFYKSLSEGGLYVCSTVEPIIFRDKDGVEKNVIVDWPEQLDSQYLAVVNALALILTPKFLEDLNNKYK